MQLQQAGLYRAAATAMAMLRRDAQVRACNRVFWQCVRADWLAPDLDLSLQENKKVQEVSGNITKSIASAF